MSKKRRSRKHRSNLGDTYNEHATAAAHPTTVNYKGRAARLNCKRIKMGKKAGCTQLLCDIGNSTAHLKNTRTGKVTTRKVNHTWRFIAGSSSCARTSPSKKRRGKRSKRK